MINFTLQRASLGKDATFGVLYSELPAHIAFTTLELPWRDNHKDVSCIPAGTYEVVTYTSARYPDVYQLLDVPGRTHILIHVGNYPHNTNGCILVGTSYGIGTNNLAIGNSSLALSKLKAVTDRFTLTIKNPA